jgi:predicted nucleotidyltransferase
MGTKSKNLIEWLFPRVRREVLVLLLTNPQDRWHLRDIQRKTGCSVNTVRRELAGLVQMEIVLQCKDGNRIYYQANAQNPVFADLAGLCRKTSGIVSLLRQAIESLSDKIRVAFIYGSVAKNTARAQSDIDLMVIGSCSFANVVKAIHPVQEQLSREINPSVYAVDEFREKVSASQHFISTILRDPKLFILGDDNELKRLG